MYIRFWSSTDASATVQLAYLRALLRWAPVRLVSMTGVLEGAWRPFTPLLLTSMDGPMINVACARPEQWAQSLTVAMPQADTMHASIARGETIPAKAESETMTRELYTESAQRNVLIALGLPTTTEQADAVQKYRSDVAIPIFDLYQGWLDAFRKLERSPMYMPAIIPVLANLPTPTLDGDALAALRLMVIAPR